MCSLPARNQWTNTSTGTWLILADLIYVPSSCHTPVNKHLPWYLVNSSRPYLYMCPLHARNQQTNISTGTWLILANLIYVSSSCQKPTPPLVPGLFQQTLYICPLHARNHWINTSTGTFLTLADLICVSSSCQKPANQHLHLNLDLILHIHIRWWNTYCVFVAT